MVTLAFFFYFMIVIFAVIGSLRGWAKEMLVTFSVILAIFIIYILQGVGIFRDLPNGFQLTNPAAYTDARTFFWMRATILIVLVFFGYQTPNLPRIGGERFARERFQDFLLGFVLGALNGFLIAGALWFFMEKAKFPYPDHIRAPILTDPSFNTMQMLLKWLAPSWLTGNTLYIAVALAFVFVIVVFL